MNGISLKNAEVKARIAGLEEEFKQYEGVKIDKERQEEELQKEIAEF